MFLIYARSEYVRESIKRKNRMFQTKLMITWQVIEFER